MKEAMQMKLGKRGEYKLYTVLFVLPMLLILFIFALGGNSFVWSADGLNQYYPVLEYIRRYLREMISSGKIQQFDLTIGLGEGIIPVLNYYGFGNPFTLFLIFVPEGGTACFLTVLVFIHLFLAGVSFLFFCSHFGYTNKYIIVAAALMYSFSTFALIQGFEFWTFLTPSVSLPLIVAGIQSIVDGKKDMACRFALIGGIFFQALNGFYFLYEIAIFGIVYFIIYGFGKKEILKWIRQGIYILFLALSGVCLAGIIFFPTVFGFLQSSRVTGEGSIELIYTWKEYGTFLQNLFIPRAFESGLGLPIPCILAIVLLWGQRHISSRIKLLTAFWGICYLSPMSGVVMNGFSYSSTRWQFILYFIAAWIFVEVSEMPLVQERKFLWLIYIVFAGIVVLLHIWSSEINYTGIFRGSLYFLAALLSVWVWKRGKSGYILGLCSVIVLLNVCMIFGPVALGASGFRAGFLTYDELGKMEENSPAQDIQKGQDTGIYRQDLWDFSLGASMILDYYGTAEYFSIENKAVNDFFREFAISPGRVATWCFYGIDGRNVLEDLLSVRYFIENRETDDGYEQVIMENDDAEPIGLFYDSYLLSEQFENMDALNRMEAVSKYVVLDAFPQNTDMEEGEMLATDYSVPFTVKYENITKEEEYLCVNEESRIYLYPDIARDEAGEIYVLFNNIERDIAQEKQGFLKVQVGNRMIQIPDAQYNVEAGINTREYLVHANYGTEIPEVIVISFSEEDKIKIENMEVYLYNPSCLPKNNEYTNVKLTEEKGKINGTIKTDRSGAVFLSVPYSNGWSAWIDGEKADIYKADVGFMAVAVTAGEHEIILRYLTPGLIPGAAAALISLTGILCYYLFMKWRWSQKSMAMGKNENTVEK